MEKTKSGGPSLPSVIEGVFVGPEFGERDHYENLKIIP